MDIYLYFDLLIDKSDSKPKIKSQHPPDIWDHVSMTLTLYWHMHGHMVISSDGHIIG